MVMKLVFSVQDQLLTQIHVLRKCIYMYIV